MTVIVPYKIAEEEVALVIRGESDGTFTVEIGDEKIEHFKKRRDLRIRLKEIVKTIGMEKKAPPIPPVEPPPEPLPEEEEIPEPATARESDSARFGSKAGRKPASTRGEKNAE